MSDYIQEFIDIKNFDASLTICPDSISIKDHSTLVFSSYLLSKVKFKMLDNRQYFAKAFSLLTDKDQLRITVNNENMIIYATDDYPLFSFDTRINFKNGEIIDYSRAVCQETGINEEDITDSDVFSYYDIFYVLMNNDEFLTALANLGYEGPFTLPTDNLSMSSTELLNLVSKIEWKFRIRLNDKDFYMQTFDWANLYVSGNATLNVITNLSQIPILSTWISEVISIT